MIRLYQRPRNIIIQGFDLFPVDDSLKDVLKEARKTIENKLSTTYSAISRIATGEVTTGTSYGYVTHADVNYHMVVLKDDQKLYFVRDYCVFGKRREVFSVLSDAPLAEINPLDRVRSVKKEDIEKFFPFAHKFGLPRKALLAAGNVLESVYEPSFLNVRLIAQVNSYVLAVDKNDNFYFVTNTKMLSNNGTAWDFNSFIASLSEYPIDVSVIKSSSSGEKNKATYMRAIIAAKQLHNIHVVSDSMSVNTINISKITIPANTYPWMSSMTGAIHDPFVARVYVGEDVVSKEEFDAMVANGDVFTCPHCGENHLVSENDYVNASGKRVCNSCFQQYYRTCLHCGVVMLRNDMYSVSGGHVCRECLREHYVSCESCGDRHERTSEYIRYIGEHAYCRSCYNDIKARVVKNYSYKPSWVKHGTSPVERFYGVEIETGVDSDEYSSTLGDFDDIMHISDCEDWFILKNDGSISGVEVVTHPATLQEWKTNNRYKKLLESLEEAGYYTEEGTGIHVHIDTQTFVTQESKRNLVRLFRRYWKEIVQFSGRDVPKAYEKDTPETKNATFETDYYDCGEFSWCKLNKWSTSIAIENFLEKQRDLGRYVAINFQNRSTVEIRIFRSSLDYDRVLDILNMVDAFVNACNADLHETDGLTFEQLIQKFGGNE